MTDELLKNLLRATEKLSGLKFTDEDVKELKPSLRRIFAGVKAMDELRMSSDVLPANLLVKGEEED